jgi:hypothetical protein
MYRTLFDLHSSPAFDAWWLVAGLVFTIGAGATWMGSRDPARGGKAPLKNTLIFAFAAFWTSVAVGIPSLTYSLHLHALETGQYHVVEGPVRDFSTRSDGKGERFTVAGVTFEYSDPEEMGRFHTTQVSGGPIRGGLVVRITYVNDDDIVRLEERTR